MLPNSTESYETKPLLYSDEQNEILTIFDNVLPIEYHSWENSIIYHSNTINTLKTDETGWIPTRECRTLATYQKEILGRNVDFIENTRFDDHDRAMNWYSIFPFTDTVILKNMMDNKNFQFDLNYKAKYINPQQDPTVMELPIEPPVIPIRKEKTTTHSNINSLKNNKENRLRRTRNVLARAGLIGILPDTHDDYHHHHHHHHHYRDKNKEDIKVKSVSFWNLSNDFYYDFNVEQEFLSKRRINSSQALFRTINELRYFHRPLLDLPNYHQSWICIQLSNIKTFNKSIRTKSDLTGAYGEILLFEYSEQYPALLNEIGMFSKIRTYLRPQYFKAHTTSYEVDYGELIYTHASPFLWSIPRGLNIQTIENNMFIASIYRQKNLINDFLIIFNRKNGFFIRNINIIYIIGQQCPLIEVPIPQSKRVNLFQRDLLQIYIYRLFLQNNEMPRRIRIDDIKRVFPRLAESSIRKRLKTSADFRRTDDFRLPTEDEIRDLIKPEFCCAYASMTAAEQRLKDAGFCDKYNIDFDDDEQSNYSSELNDEILQAPWNTTRAYLGALKGKCLMQVFGIGTKTIHKTKTNNDLKHFRRAVTGTDADLRRLQLKDARKLLLKFNISEKVIQSLSRWEIVDLVRTLSTQQAKEGIGGGMAKFARGIKHLQAQQFEKYKENCQKQFELQNRLFTCTDEQLTDDDTSEDDEENAQLLDEMSRTLENLLRQNNEMNSSTSISNERPKMLHIIRTYIDDQGQSYQQEEFIRNNDSVIQAYIKIRQTKNDKFIKAYYTLDESEREILKRERRRLQEQLRRVKRNEARYNQHEKQQMLLQIQQQNLALIQSTETRQLQSLSSSPIILKRSNSILSNLQLSLSEEEEEEDDDDHSSSSIS
ncbi:unnamed protein product [Rotaria sordida]|uniref:Transcription initiation factor TFIID subunit 1 histone acetyltransferase domain-containing protein n=1 Tax=Rotaria sordida TaxID=392033 RepID=A0A814XCI1_9BILA|nr:unnamed protein product [Rotaria sordida]